LGLQRLDDITATYKIFAHLAHSPPCPAEDVGKDQPEGRGWTATGVFSSRRGPGEGSLRFTHLRNWRALEMPVVDVRN
jgi:hypothetical protein